MRCLSAIFVATAAFAAVSCESVRTVYDDSGEVVKERKAGQSSSLEDRFAGGFSTKKNAMGIETASSKKVSSFQAAIDGSKGVAGSSSFQGKTYGGNKSANDIRDKSFTQSMSSFADMKSFKDSSKTAYTPDDVPSFMKGGRGITPEKYAGANKKSSASDRVFDSGEAYEKVMSSSTTGTRSAYIDSKPEAQKTIYTKDEYAQKTIEETRGLLQRDKTKY